MVNSALLHEGKDANPAYGCKAGSTTPDITFFVGRGVVRLYKRQGRSSGEDNFTSSILLILFNCTSHVWSLVDYDSSPDSSIPIDSTRSIDAKL